MDIINVYYKGKDITKWVESLVYPPDPVPLEYNNYMVSYRKSNQVEVLFKSGKVLFTDSCDITTIKEYL